MRIVFIGTGDIGLPSLEALLQARGHQVVGVITQPDKPVGRKQTLTPPRVKTLALASGVLVLQPARIRESVEEFRALHADVFVVAAYGQILSRAVLDVPRAACLNVHASLLPRHRGASPVQAAIRVGDPETGITIMWMNEGLDTGDILLQRKLPITPDETGGTLHDKLAAMAPECLMEALRQIENGQAPHVPQENAQATLTRKLNREHGRLDWHGDAVELERTIRAYDPWPGTYCLWPLDGGKHLHLKVHRAGVPAAAATGDAAAGTLMTSTEHRLLVACSAGVLELQEVQLEGRKRMSAQEFLHGHVLKPGLRLE